MNIRLMLLGGIGLGVGLMYALGRERVKWRGALPRGQGTGVSGPPTTTRRESVAPERTRATIGQPLLISEWGGAGLGVHEGLRQHRTLWARERTTRGLTSRFLIRAVGGALLEYGVHRRGLTGAAFGSIGCGMLTWRLIDTDLCRRALAASWPWEWRPPGWRSHTPYPPPCQKISLWIKVPYTLFLCILVPVYAVQYGLANFLWFSDIALLVTLPALWRESRMLASMQAVSVTLLEGVWIIDFVAGVMTGSSPFGLAAYMFDPGIPLFLRALSLFHLVLPPLLLWLVSLLGYDSRAWIVQTLFSWVLLPLCYCCTDPAANINWVFGPGDKPQTWMPAWLYLFAVMLIFPFGIYLPTHWVLRRLSAQIFTPATRGEPDSRAEPGGTLRHSGQ